MESAIREESLDLARRGEAFGELGEIDVPVTVAYGTRDRLVRWPSHYVRLRRMLPTAEWVLLDGAGHMPMWEQPDRVAEIILETTRRSAPGASSWRTCRRSSSGTSSMNSMRSGIHHLATCSAR